MKSLPAFTQTEVGCWVPQRHKMTRLSLSCRNRAIADYLRSNGYEEAYSTFKKEAELDMVRTGDVGWLKATLGF